MAIVAAAAVVLVAVVLLMVLLCALGYDLNEECKPSEECKTCPFPRCENKQEKESEVKQ